MVRQSRRSAHGFACIVTDRDDGVRRFWAAYIGSQVDASGDVPGFATFEHGMTDQARRLVWKQAEDFARWAMTQPRDVADDLAARVRTAKLLVQAGAMPVDGFVPERETTEPDQTSWEF
jgi:hypothetical protein